MKFLGWVLREDAIRCTIIIVSDDGVMIMRPGWSRWWAEEHESFDAAAASASHRIEAMERSGYQISDPIVVELPIQRSDLVDGPLDQNMMNELFKPFLDATVDPDFDLKYTSPKKMFVHHDGNWIEMAASNPVGVLS